MINDLLQEFSFLIKEKGYSVQVEPTSYLVKNLIFTKGNIQIIFECELMSRQFDFEIHVLNANNEYSICEFKGRRELYYKNKDNNSIFHRSIFEYVNEDWSESKFQLKKEIIYKSRFLINSYHKKFLLLISLYKELLSEAIENIENSLIEQ